MNDNKIVQKAFGYKLIGTKFMKKVVADATLMLPDNIAYFVTKHMWFVSSFTDGYAFTLRRDDLKKGEYLVFLSDELLGRPTWRIKFSILHEIGHAYLGHKNSIGVPQSKREVGRQEKEADEFAKKYMIGFGG